ncbi:histone deacetylase [Frankia canadensis]|nr:histone deacetylase [Frankia canadensis]
MREVLRVREVLPAPVPHPRTEPAIPRGEIPAARSVRRGPAEQVWYASYGSNMRLARLTCYLAGGVPPGSAHRHPGCRDPRPPRLASPVVLPGAMYFATESRLWTGGVAYYDPAVPGEVPGRAYLLTASQFADVAAQEMHRPPGVDLDLTTVLRTGRAELGPGRYETLVLVGHRAGVPVLTFTAPWAMADVAPNAPSTAYLAMLATGLREAHGWSPRRIAEYLATRPGATGTWHQHDVERLITS